MPEFKEEEKKLRDFENLVIRVQAIEKKVVLDRSKAIEQLALYYDSHSQELFSDAMRAIRTLELCARHERRVLALLVPGLENISMQLYKYSQLLERTYRKPQMEVVLRIQTALAIITAFQERIINIEVRLRREEEFIRSQTEYDFLAFVVEWKRDYNEHAQVLEETAQVGELQVYFSKLPQVRKLEHIGEGINRGLTKMPGVLPTTFAGIITDGLVTGEPGLIGGAFFAIVFTVLSVAIHVSLRLRTGEKEVAEEIRREREKFVSRNLLQQPQLRSLIALP